MRTPHGAAMASIYPHSRLYCSHCGQSLRRIGPRDCPVCLDDMGDQRYTVDDVTGALRSSGEIMHAFLTANRAANAEKGFNLVGPAAESICDAVLDLINQLPREIALGVKRR